MIQIQNTRTALESTLRDTTTSTIHPTHTRVQQLNLLIASEQPPETKPTPIPTFSPIQYLYEEPKRRTCTSDPVTDNAAPAYPLWPSRITCDQEKERASLVSTFAQAHQRCGEGVGRRGLEWLNHARTADTTLGITILARACRHATTLYLVTQYSSEEKGGLPSGMSGIRTPRGSKKEMAVGTVNQSILLVVVCGCGYGASQRSDLAQGSRRQDFHPTQVGCPVETRL